MEKIYLILSLIILNLFSCNDSYEETAIIGKWYIFSPDNEYDEFYIYKDHLYIYSYSGGRFDSIPYLIIDDSLKYDMIDFKFSAKITKLSDSEIILRNNQWSDTLHKLDDTITVLHEIVRKDEKSFNNFYRLFMKRQYEAWIKHGYITKQELLESFKDTVEIDEEELSLELNY